MEIQLRKKILVFSVIISTAFCFLDHPTQDEPKCVWYGECGPGWNNGKLNCPANATTKLAPRMTDPEGLRILRDYCPSLYNGTNSRTCCSMDQLRALRSGMALPAQLLSSCPACFHNFVDQVCQMTCSPHQSQFLWADFLKPKPPGYTTGIQAVTFVVTEKYAASLFSSCKEVEMPSVDEKALSVFCGRSISQCTPHNWLQYMGDTGNGQAPFTVDYVFSDGPWIAPDGSVLRPLDKENAPCNQTLNTSSTVFGKEKCRCMDCYTEKCPPPPKPTNVTRKNYFDATFGKGKYEAIEIKISRKDSQAMVSHMLPPPSVSVVNFTSIYDKEFLHQILKLQNAIANLTATVDDAFVSLDDVCLKLANQKDCVIESVLQYYQNNVGRIDKVVYDPFHIFIVADYLDHYMSCTHDPKLQTDITADQLPCGAVFGGITQPYIVLEGYKGYKDYANATSFVITFLLRTNVIPSKVEAWERSFAMYMKNYNNPNMSITYTKMSEVTAQTPVFRVVPDQSYSIPSSDIPDQKYRSVDIRNLDNDLVYTNNNEDEPILEVDNADEGHCVWYGQCGDGWNQGALNCPATNETVKPPKLTDKDGLRILKQYCTDLYHGDNDTYTCCNTDQLHAIEGNLALPNQILSRCPACYHNFLNQICLMTCSPRQSNFLIRNLVDSCPDGTKTTDGLCGKGIVSVTYVMTPKYASDLYTSCKDVQMPSANEKAISLFCGRPADECNSTIWLSYMGNTGNGRAPFPIYYNYSNVPYDTPRNQSINPLNNTNTRCNETFSNSSAKCSCQDCESSCAPVPPPPPAKKPFTILGIDGISFIMGCIFAGFVIFFGSYAICYNIVCRDTLDIDSKGASFNEIDTECCDYGVGGSRRNLVQQMLVSPADISGLEKFGAKVEHILETVFKVWGRWCAKYPAIVLLISVIFFGAMAGGIAKYDVTTDPVKLWSSSNSTARMQKRYFDSHFGPFYRTEQIIISRPYNKTKIVHPYPPPSTSSINFSSLFDKEFMHQVLDLQNTVEKLVAIHDNKTVTLEDICFKPLSPDNNNCTIESVLQYWRNDKEQLDKVIYDQFHIFDMSDYMDHFLKCTQAPTSVSDTLKLEMSCLATYGGPAFPWVVLGGYDGVNYQNATAFVITFVVNNHVDESENARAEAWEAEFIKFMKQYKNENMTISFSSERSIQDELNRESKSDIWTILVSYLIMFGYITIALGHFRSVETIFVDSKVTLGLAGVTIVLLSVAASVGFYSYCNVPMTLIIIEVVPFLVLAVGVDNIFILVQTYQRDERKSHETLEDQIGRILGRVGPSMLLTSLSESTAFFLGALTDMPAVREFALYAALAVLFDFILQITCFVSLMTFDARRQESNRFDICCCVKPEEKSSKTEKSEGCLYSFVNNYYSHALLAEWVRPIVVVVFVGWFMASIAFTCHLEVGLDQALSMPKDSFVLDYFRNISAYLSVGAPVYFVVPAGLNYTSATGQNAVCGGKGCPQNSLIGQVFRSSQIPNYTYIAQPASSWIDDYFDWLNSEGDPPCCRLYNGTGKFCPATVNDTSCIRCPFQPQIGGRPTPHDFMTYLPSFLKDNPGLKCSKGGHAAYGSAVNLIHNGSDVGATYFMTFHTTLKTSGDYINALKEARSLATDISTAMNLTEPHQQIFPYSVFYVFYEQYLTIIRNTIMNIGICMGSIFLVTFILLGFDIVTAIVVCVTILMIVIDIMGMMYLWDIDLNALSLVNLVMAIGISVEFCSHIARAFAVSVEPSKVLRAKDALAHMGSSVLSGITLTKLGGIIVLAFSKSQLFQVFYFRMYLGMVVFGATHGLMFLPVFLSYVGPSINKQKLYQHQQAIKKASADNLPKIGHHQNHIEEGQAGAYRHLNSAASRDYSEPPEYNSTSHEKL